MKLKLDSIQGGLSVEKKKNPNCTIMRHIYIWESSVTKRTLLRIYEFKTKTIVIASQLYGAVILEEYLISKVVQDFELDTDHLSWICHVGLFSDFRPAEEKFLDTIIECKKSSIFGQKNCEYIKTEEIDLENVEERIECCLEPVEKWLGLDPTIQQERQEEDREIKQDLLYLHWQNNLEFLSKQNEFRELLPQALVGAFFFYSDRNKDNGECIKFEKYTDIKRNNDNCKKIALSYLTKYHPDEEIVICMYKENRYCQCTTLPKQAFLTSIHN